MAKNRRIIVVWNNNDGIVPKAFFKGIRQGWYKGAKSKVDLQICIEKDLQSEKIPSSLWTIGACLPATVFSPVKAIPELTSWFTPGNTWTSKANIIQIDFTVSTRKISIAHNYLTLNYAHRMKLI